jgi:hypothetical protein
MKWEVDVQGPDPSGGLILVDRRYELFPSIILLPSLNYYRTVTIQVIGITGKEAFGLISSNKQRPLLPYCDGFTVEKTPPSRV